MSGGNNILELDKSKAGMQQVDKKAVERVVNDMSKGSPFYQNEQRKQDARDQRIAKHLRKSAEFDALPADRKAQLQATVDKEVDTIFKCARVGRYCFCDMDAFHAACEELDQPHLKNVPMAVGGIGMLGTSNYEARKFGVRAAMPGYIAVKLCPKLVIVPSHFEKYERATQKVRAVAAQFDPEFVSHGGDELCVKLTKGCYRRAKALKIKDMISAAEQQKQQQNDDPSSSQPAVAATEVPDEIPDDFELSEGELVEDLRRRIFDATKLTASAGVGPTRTLAKIASNFNKPNGQHILEARTPEQVRDYAWEHLSVRQIPGIGKVSEQMLGRLGVKTCKELFDNRVRLKYVFLEKTFSFLLQASVGLIGAVSSTPQRHHGFFPRQGNAAADVVKQEQRLEEDSAAADEGDLFADDRNKKNNHCDDKKEDEDDSDRTSSDDDDGGVIPFHNNAHVRKHSVGGERTFHIKINSRNESMRMVDKVFRCAIERLVDVAPCRVYQLGVKAKRVNFQVSSSSANVSVVLPIANPDKEEKNRERYGTGSAARQ